MTEILHLCAGRHCKDMSVTSLVELLFVKLGDIRTPAFNHSTVICVIAGSQDNCLGSIKLNIFAVTVLTDNTCNLAAFEEELNCRRREECLKVRVLLFYVLQCLTKSASDVQRLRSDPRREEVALVIAVIVNLFPVLPNACEKSAGTHERTKILAVIQKRSAILIAVDFAAVTVLSLLCHSGSVEHPHHRFLGMIGISAKLLSIRSPVAKAVRMMDPLRDTCLS